MHAPVLIIENATDAGSVVVARANGTGAAESLASIEFGARDAVTGARTEALGLAVREALVHAGVDAASLGAIVCDGGPGSFTSLRCAAAIAKGMCAPLGLPLHAVSSLELLARVAPITEAGVYLVAIDAGRREWFVSEVRVDDDGSRTVGAFEVCDDATLRARAGAMRAPLVGRELDIDAVPHARGALGILDRILATPAVALDSWEPEYGRLAEAQVKWEAAHGRPLVV